MNIAHHCQNCESRLIGKAKYCSQCGQSVLTNEKPIRPVMTEMFHETLDIDGRIMLSLKTLLFKPGLLSLEYKKGRRSKYTPPLRMYLVISILFFLLVSVIEFGGNNPVEGSAARSDVYSKLMFVLLPVFALFLQLLFRQTYYLSNLVFAIHVHCIAYLTVAIIIPLEAYENDHTFFMYLQLPCLLYLLTYILLALKRFYAQSWSSITIKFFALFFLYSILMGISFDYLLQRFTL